MTGLSHPDSWCNRGSITTGKFKGKVVITWTTGLERDQEPIIDSVMPKILPTKNGVIPFI